MKNIWGPATESVAECLCPPATRSGVPNIQANIAASNGTCCTPPSLPSCIQCAPSFTSTYLPAQIQANGMPQLSPCNGALQMYQRNGNGSSNGMMPMACSNATLTSANYGAPPSASCCSQSANSVAAGSFGMPYAATGNGNMCPCMPQMAQGMPQMGQGMSQKCPCMPQMIQGMPQMGQGMPQVCQCVPQTTQSMPQMGQCMPRMGKCMPQMTQGMPQMGQCMPQMGQCMPQMTQGMQQMAPCTPCTPGSSFMSAASRPCAPLGPNGAIGSPPCPPCCPQYTNLPQTSYSCPCNPGRPDSGFVDGNADCDCSLAAQGDPYAQMALALAPPPCGCYDPSAAFDPCTCQPASGACCMPSPCPQNDCCTAAYPRANYNPCWQCTDTTTCVSPAYMLIGGQIHTEVDCHRRNGLQDYCKMCSMNG